jgi:type I restriction enzyme S subunit
MIETLKPFENYRDAAFGLPRLPSHWTVRRTKSLLREIDRRTRTGTERLLSLRMNAGLVDHHEMGGKFISSSALIGFKHVLPGEIVMNRMRAAVGLFGAAISEGLVSPDYAIFTVRPELRVEYAVSLFKTPTMMSLFRLESRGLGTGESGFLRLYSDRFGRLRMPLPPPEEQAAIVRFLDHANRRIDRFIRAKRKLIRAASEAREVVTDAAMRDQRVDGVRISSVAALVSRPVTRERGIHYVKLGLRNRGRGIFHRPPQLGEHLGDSDFFWVEPGDLVISGQFAWEGAIAIASEAERGTVVSHRYPVIRAKDGAALTPYLWALLRSRYGDLLFDVHSRGAAGRNRPLNERTLLKEKVPVPPLEAQQRVADFVATEESVRRSVERAILPVLEYRTRLVADVVTGQLDVREAAARLPEEEPEAVDEIEVDDEGLSEGEVGDDESVA